MTDFTHNANVSPSENSAAMSAAHAGRGRIIWVLLGMLCAAAMVVATGALIRGNAIPDNVGHPLEGEELQQVIDRNSPLIDYAHLTRNADFPRDRPISKITIHHMAGDLDLEALGYSFQERDRQASSNYAIDSDGNVALYVEEANRAWTSRNRENDEQAVTIEVANDEMGEPWHVSDAAFDTLVDLCVDICERNGISELVYTGTPEGSLTYHSMFDTNTECPGPYLISHMDDLAKAVNARLAQHS